MNWKRLFLVAILGALVCAPGWADLVGTSVTGSLTFGGNPLNFFDPVNGFVPNGPLNKTQGTTVTISSSAIEFGFQDPDNTDTADFTGTQLTLTDISSGGQAAARFTFTDAAFAGVTLSPVSNTFPVGFGAVLDGSTLTISFPQFLQSGTFDAVFSLTPTTAIPEPGSIALLLSALCGAGYAVRKRLR